MTESTPKLAQRWALLKSLNQLPLNQLCLQLLRQEKEAADPLELYSLQLLLWACENLAQGAPSGLVEDLNLKEQAYLLLHPRDPKWAQDQLLNPDDGENLEERALSAADQLKGKDLESVAALLAENLEASMYRRWTSGP